jgi:hypothetical protein
LNSCVQSSAENSWIQEKNAEKRKKNCAKKARHHQQRMSIMGYPKGLPPPPLPPLGGGGGGGGARSMPSRGWHGICWEQVPCQVRVKIEKRFLRFFLTLAKISSVNARSMLERK